GVDSQCCPVGHVVVSQPSGTHPPLFESHAGVSPLHGYPADALSRHAQSSWHVPFWHVCPAGHLMSAHGSLHLPSWHTCPYGHFPGAPPGPTPLPETPPSPGGHTPASPHGAGTHNSGTAPPSGPASTPVGFSQVNPVAHLNSPEPQGSRHWCRKQYVPAGHG